MVVGMLVWLLLASGPDRPTVVVAPKLVPTNQPPALPDLPLEEHRPEQKTHGGYVGSTVCLECHQDNHESWHASYHRTMTQIAQADRAMGNFDDVHLNYPSRKGMNRFHLLRRGTNLWAGYQLADVPGFDPQQPYLAPIVMTTGSHHMQAYWMATGQKRTMAMLPVIYWKEAERWIPRRSAFLLPPTEEFTLEVGRWDRGCIQCHATGGHPRETIEHGRVVFDSSAAEFGVSCEACHGPAKKHVELQKVAKRDGEKQFEDPIVNPADLPHELSAQVCGACHNSIDFLDPKHNHLPGQPINTNAVIEFDLTEKTVAHLRKEYPDLSDEQFAQWKDVALAGHFWPDGHSRVVGREYAAIREAGCYERGTISCLSCHRMHRAKGDSRTLAQWAEDQLGEDMRSDQACTQCHEQTSYATEAHTHHPRSSTGSRCYNCHMPHTSYGLLKAVRGHTISSPSAIETLEIGRPNACNLCHLDQTLDWTSVHLENWYQVKRPAMEPHWTNTAASVVWALRGDASVRALTAWHLGWKPAREISKTAEWAPPYLGILMDDPYDAVRYIAGRSLRTLPEFRDVNYDFLAAPEDRLRTIREVATKWPGFRRGPERGDRRFLLNPQGRLDQVILDENLRKRDHRAISIME